MRHVILCDEHGNPKGTTSIEDAHKSPGKLHRAFSIFVFRNEGKEILIQKRAYGKLFGGLWANTCCSHPQDGVSIVKAGEKRLKEECGFTCLLQEHSSFVYRAEDPEKKGVEHEYDTILIGNIEEEVQFLTDPQEVEEVKWIDVDELQKDMRHSPEKYGPWFSIALKKILGK